MTNDEMKVALEELVKALWDDARVESALCGCDNPTEGFLYIYNKRLDKIEVARVRNTSKENDHGKSKPEQTGP